MSIRIFHGGCHSCISQIKHTLERCENCQYHQVDWDKPNLFLPEPKNLLDIIDESQERFRQSSNSSNYHGEPSLERLDDGTYMVRNKYSHTYYRANSLIEIQKMIGVVWDIRNAATEIEDQIRAGYDIPLEFLEAYGKDFLNEIEIHPNYDDEVLPLIIENGLDHLLPKSAQDIFVF